MKAMTSGFLAVGLLTASAAHGGSITFLRDTDAELRGTFMFSGVPSDSVTDVTPAAFDLSPGAEFCGILQGARVWYADSNFGIGGFGLQCVTTPDNAARSAAFIRSRRPPAFSSRMI